MAAEAAVKTDETAEQGDRHDRKTPPYIAYATFKSVLNNFKTQGIPPEVNKSAFPSFSGGVQSQVMLALRSLGLISTKNEPTPELEALVNAYETPSYKKLLAALLKETYPYVLALDLMTVTPSTFADSFKDNTGAKEDVLRKCRTFFLNAARDADISIGPRLEKASFPRVRPIGVKKARKAAATPPSPSSDENTGQLKTKDATPIVKELLGKFPEFDPKWPDDIKKKWFEGFERFMSGAGVPEKDDGN